MALNLYMLLIPKIKCLSSTFSWHLTQESPWSSPQHTPLPAVPLSAKGTKLRHDLWLSLSHPTSNPSGEPIGPSFKMYRLAISTITTQIHSTIISLLNYCNNWSPGFHFGPKQLVTLLKHKSDHALLPTASDTLLSPCHKALSNRPLSLFPFLFSTGCSSANGTPILEIFLLFLEYYSLPS